MEKVKYGLIGFGGIAENRIAKARSNYNEKATEYNVAIRKFPKNIIASMFGFEKKPYFEAAEGAQEAPKVEF